MKRNILAAVFAAIFIAGCGTAGDGADKKTVSKSSGVAKENVCTLLTTAEVSKLVGEPVHEGEMDTKHIYPTTSVCTWTSVSHDMPLLTLTYYLNTSSHDLNYYAPPSSSVEKLTIPKYESIAVLTSRHTLLEVIVRSGSNAILLMAPYLESKDGSTAWKSEVDLANLAAQRASRTK